MSITKGGSIILRIYFALVTFVTLMMLIFSVSDLINIGLRTYVFKGADAPEFATYCSDTVGPNAKPVVDGARTDCKFQEERDRKSADVRKQQNAVRDIAMILVSAPLFWLHWRVVYRDWMEGKDGNEKQKDA